MMNNNQNRNDTPLFDFDQLGKLYLEENLVEFDIPLLFVCRNEHNEQYTVLCIDETTLPIKYLAIKSTNDKLVEMLTNKITMYDFFKKCSSNKVIYFSSESFCRFGKATEIVDEDLPTKDCFFELKNDKIEKYIQKLSIEKSSTEQSYSLQPWNLWNINKKKSINSHVSFANYQFQNLYVTECLQPESFVLSIKKYRKIGCDRAVSCFSVNDSFNTICCHNKGNKLQKALC